jgi:hypothetical protein
MTRSWKDHEIERLRQCCTDGFTLNQTAIKMEITRSMVAGKAYRLGLKFAGTPAPKKPSVQWTDEMIDKLRQFSEDGFMHGWAALALGLSVGSVCHKAEKLGLRFRGRSSSAAAPAARPRVSSHIIAHKIKLHATEKPPRTAPDMDNMLLVPFMEAREFHCRWPAMEDDEFRFCGLNKTKGSYCAAHAKLAYCERTS